jgi:hypothetical protein
MLRSFPTIFSFTLQIVGRALEENASEVLSVEGLPAGFGLLPGKVFNGSMEIKRFQPMVKTKRIGEGLGIPPGLPLGEDLFLEGSVV